MNLPLAEYLAERKQRIDEALARWLPELSQSPAEDPRRLREAMRYAVLGDGKRLRPILALAACEACGGPTIGEEAALRAACAVELVHCYSLVHDDLPAMDDDDLRRGRPTVHRAFDEATAILVGDALLTLAFAWAIEAGPDAVTVLARRAGHEGMILGQARDLELAGEEPALALLERLHAEKTGDLFAAATTTGAICAGAPSTQREALARFGLAVGILFQYADDVQDDEHRSFAPAIRDRSRALIGDALASLSIFPAAAAAPLAAVATQVGQRALGDA